MKSGFIAIVGRPNSGKSTLLNRVIGADLSIVSPKAQTTRERLHGILTEKQGQIVFIDTPGIHKAQAGGINECMVAEAKEALEGPSLVWYLVDPTSAAEHESEVLQHLMGAARERIPVFIIWTKTDLKTGPKPDFRATLLEKSRNMKLNIIREFTVSAKTKQGISELLTESWKQLPEGPLFYEDPEQLSDRPTRYFVSEKIREKLYRCLGDEVPYSCSVSIDKFEEPNRKSNLTRIEATIFVERESQKGILIGKSGSKIKEIGQMARQDIEKFLGHQIFLGLKVELLKNWTRDPEALKKMGYA